ncbi:MAG: NAD(P)-dependent oxidoreductase [Muribaculaceae bacterium]|nr:NAD(P)-dependent oxidoreductase [Muribaculaceae bacterium]
MDKKKILITGAGGFIGGFIVQEAINDGYETWAAVRKTTSRKFLVDERINFIELDFTDATALHDTLQQHVAEHGKWDYVVHNLGATKATNYIDFENVNFYYMKLLVDTLKDIEAVPEVFLLMSSLSVMGPGDEVNYTPFKATDIPAPNTRYGLSKAKAENYLRMQTDFPYTIFRCTGVYGPHERDYYLMMKSIKRSFDFSVGFKKQMLTFIYVKDLARAVMLALEKGPLRNAYFISEDKAYSQKEFRKIVADELHKKFVIPVVCPIWLVRCVCACSQWIGKVTGKPSTLNLDKFKILKQRNWLCDTTDAQRDFGFTAQYPLQQGVHEAIEWYKQAGWL